MKIKIFIILILLIFSANKLICQYYEEKDPFIAGLLSSTMMGLGQFYAKEYTKGSLFILTDLIDKVTLIWMVVALNEKYTDESKNDMVVEWKELTKTDKSLVIGYFVTHFGLKILCIIDAVYSANRYNDQILKHKSSSNLNFGFKVTMDNSCIFYCNKKF